MFQKLVNDSLASQGNYWNPPNYLAYKRFSKYDDGFLDDIYDGLAVTASTGLLQFQQELGSLIEWNAFKLVNRFYKTHIFAENPPIVPKDNNAEELKEWLDEHHDNILRVLKMCIVQYISKGKYVIVVRRDLDTGDIYMESIPSEYHWPVELDRTTGKVNYHLLAYEQRIPLLTTRFEHYNTTVDYPNAITFVRFKKNEINNSITHKFTGRIIGQVVSNPLKTDILDIFTFGDGFSESMYQLIEDPVRRILLALSAKNKIIHRNASPHTQAASGSSITSLDEIDPAGDLLLIEDPMARKEWKYLELSGQLAYLDKFVEQMETMIHQSVSIPPVVFGHQTGSNESGQARLLLTKGTNGNIQSIRHGINLMINPLMQSLGAPEGEVYLNWTTDIFATASEQSSTVMMWLDRGLVTKQEAREILKLGAMPQELIEMEQQQKQQNMMMQQQQNNNNNEGEQNGRNFGQNN